jgi:hypothetical protein
MNDSKEEFKKKIRAEMAADFSNSLEKNFSLAKQFIRVTNDGFVDVLVKDKVNGPEKIQLYLIGKKYAKQGEFTTSDEVGNKELMERLGIPEGSLMPWLSELRDKNKITQLMQGRNAYHSIPVNLIEVTLKAVEKKVQKEKA